MNCEQIPSFENKPAVAILLATYNGEAFLRAQLESISRQSFLDWGLYCSDDGSLDQTKFLIDEFSVIHPKKIVQLFNGPCSGFAKNFLSLVCNKSINAQYFAYADQDDVWMGDKLLKATQWLSRISSETPALYCSRTEYVDEQLMHIGFSSAYQRPPIFKNALVQNIASGNTMVFNQAARALIQAAGPEVDIPLHDWWTYILLSGAGGKVFFDPNPSVLYRQHEANLWGMNAGWAARFARIKKLFQGRFKSWNERHLQEIDKSRVIFTSENLVTVDLFAKCRLSKSIFLRVFYLLRSGVYRQTLMANMGLIVATLFHKI
jgi:glycosyltransferase involved in cell wall biosynthesis